MTLRASPLDIKLGMEVYASTTPGVGGRIRSRFEDFIVEEILLDGSEATIRLKEEMRDFSKRGRYLICILIKKGIDTLSAIERVARRVNVSPEMIGAAGIKDAHAITAQHVSVGAVTPEKVKVDLGEIRLVPMRFSEEKITPRILLGNRFDITVRNIPHEYSETQEMILETSRELMRLGGVPNFFGHQRFGTVRPLSHIIGKLLLKEKFEKAAMIFLSELSIYESPRARSARIYLRESVDFNSALKRFPRSLFYERLMLMYLSKYPRDFLGAFRRLPINLRRLFIQAYQSYLFNRFLSERMKRGIPLNDVQKGDYALRIGDNGLPGRSFIIINEKDVGSVSSEIKSGKMALALPVIGFNQKLSGGIQGEIEREILEREDVQPQDFKMEKMPECGVGGKLRRALAPIMNFRFKTKPDDKAIVRFRFMLHKGSYATVVLREFMKPENPVSSGF
ncbi:tRNA pseudouridine(13) synthase TruD [Candidatus Bathyarchaeota archaeon]|nr:MAG: tRNA pseudouridine(13) synthase TruD [Candidatus Bathyarchaeota archaeon]